MRKIKRPKHKGKQILEYLQTSEPGKPDSVLLLVVALLLLIGIIAVFSASIMESRVNFDGNAYGYFTRQLLYGLIGGVIFGFILYRIPFDVLRKYSVLFFLASLVFAIMVFVPGIGIEQNATNRWVNLGLFTFQPSELIKLCFVIYLAAWIEKHQKNIKNREVLLPFLTLLGLLAFLLILQPDFSTLILIAVISGVIYFVAGAPWKYIIGLSALGGIVSLIVVSTVSYRLNRVITFLDSCENTDTLGVGYHICRAFTAIGSGQWTGVGITQGIQQQGPASLPEAMNDSIFAVWANETGFVGACFLIILVLLLLWRSLIIAQRSQSQFTAFIAVGVAVWIFIQAMINIGSVLNLIPFTGIPLPYISYGSSSLVTVLGATGLLLHISKQAKQKTSINRRM